MDNWREAGKPPLKGSPFTSTLLQLYLDVITREALLDGYPDAVIHPALTAHGDTVDVTLDIEPGAQAVIDSLVLTGLTRTRGDVIRRELDRLRGARADRASIELRDHFWKRWILSPSQELPRSSILPEAVYG